MKLPPISVLSYLCRSSSAVAEPFDEMTLSDRQLELKVQKLRTKGYFTIPVARPTHKFLQKQAATVPSAVNQTHVRGFEHSVFEATTTAMATRVVSRLKPGDLPLAPTEFQIRNPSAASASDWHQDRAPKFLTCITTLKGAGTQFVSPGVFKAKFNRVSDIPRIETPIGGEDSIREDVRTTKLGKFYVFANLGVDDPQVPKLLHRAQGEPGRSIFLARWKKNPRV